MDRRTGRLDSAVAALRQEIAPRLRRELDTVGVSIPELPSAGWQPPGQPDDDAGILQVVAAVGEFSRAVADFGTLRGGLQTAKEALQSATSAAETERKAIAQVRLAVAALQKARAYALFRMLRDLCLGAAVGAGVGLLVAFVATIPATWIPPQWIPKWLLTVFALAWMGAAAVGPFLTIDWGERRFKSPFALGLYVGVALGYVIMLHDWRIGAGELVLAPLLYICYSLIAFVGGIFAFRRTG